MGEARRRLPREFITRVDTTFPQHVAERILRGMGARRPATLRVNTLRYDASALLRFFRENAVKHQRVPWYPDAFVLTEVTERDVEKWQPYAEGRIYLQSLSSMIPALALDPRPGENILDIAAAPGSKTIQMAALMRNEGRILANELSGVRAERLSYNVRRQGCGIVEVKVGRGEKIGDEMPESFDRVLLDVPCSGEGRFGMRTAPAETARQRHPRAEAWRHPRILDMHAEPGGERTHDALGAYAPPPRGGEGAARNPGRLCRDGARAGFAGGPRDTRLPRHAARGIFCLPHGENGISTAARNAQWESLPARRLP